MEMFRLAEITLAFGREKLKFNLASKHFGEVLKPKDFVENQSPEDFISRSLNSPTYSKPFAQIFRANHRTLIIVPDKTRNCGVEIVEHDSKNSNELTFLGTTKFETPIFINRQVLAADFVMVAGAALHHYFAGYGGGPKMINPGCAGYETITKNHALTIDSENGTMHPRCRAGVLEGNPVQEDIEDSMRFVKVDFLFETILNEQGEIAKVVCGDLVRAHKEACEIVDAHYKIPIHEKAELVVVSCGGFPKDINFIQAHKSIQNAFQAVKEGGVILVLAECRLHPATGLAFANRSAF